MLAKDLGQLKLDLAKGNLTSIVTFSRQNYFFLKSLLRLSIIREFVEVEMGGKKKYRITFITYQKKITIKKLIVTTKSKANTTYSCNVLNKLKHQNFYIISTNIGIIDILTCVFKKTGGVMICKIIV